MNHFILLCEEIINTIFNKKKKFTIEIVKYVDDNGIDVLKDQITQHEITIDKFETETFSRRLAYKIGKIVNTVNNHRIVPVFLGVVNSLGFCPALFIILTKGATQGTLVQSYLAFIAFFIGSSLWFIPLPLAGRIRKKEVLTKIGILTTGLAGIIFMIKGLTNLIGGLING